MIITTTNEISGYVIEDYKGLVSASQVTGTNVFSDIIASYSDFFGGRSGTYRAQLESLYKEVNATLINDAKLKGANAIIGYHLDFDELSGGGKSMFMVTAIGTAVKIGKDRLQLLKSLHEIFVFHRDGLMTDEEYEHEKIRLEKILKNPIADEVTNEAMIREEKERAMRLAAELAEKERLKKEEEEKNLSEKQREEKKKAEQAMTVIEAEFFKKKTQVEKVSISEIMAASYDGLIPSEELSAYNVIRYLVAIDRPDAACKYYVDTYKLYPQDAIDYLIELYKIIESK